MKRKLPISGVLITFNAASRLEQALESLTSFCQELVVVDSGSTDNTVNIANRFNARVIQHPFEDFGTQKRFAVNQASHDWVFCLDADEEVSTPLKNAIEKQFSQSIENNIAGFENARCNTFLGRFLKYGEGYPDLNCRLFHRQRAQWSNDKVHEKVQTKPNFKLHRLQGDLLHFSADSLEHYINKQNRYTTIQANELANQGKQPNVFKIIGSPVTRFIKFYVIKLGFLDGWQGLIHISIGSFFCMIKYAKTRSISHKKQEN